MEEGKGEGITGQEKSYHQKIATTAMHSCLRFTGEQTQTCNQRKVKSANSSIGCSEVSLSSRKGSRDRTLRFRGNFSHHSRFSECDAMGTIL